MSSRQTYIGLLRGINVGGHHKVPMADLRREMKDLEFKNVKTVLNSGNMIFDGDSDQEAVLEEKIATHLQQVFGFGIPVLVQPAEEILALINADPFDDVELTEDIRLYTTFLKEVPEDKLTLPWISEDESFRIIDIREKIICSVLDLSATKTPKGMNSLEQLFGKNITTRNWNTANRIADKLSNNNDNRRK